MPDPIVILGVFIAGAVFGSALEYFTLSRKREQAAALGVVGELIHRCKSKNKPGDVCTAAQVTAALIAYGDELRRNYHD